MHWLNYHHLYYFYVIATEGSVVKAAETLRLAQSTLSAQLKQFEAAIGCRLFERRSRRLFLTARGRRVFDYASEIFALGEELKMSLTDRAGSESLRIGVLESVPNSVTLELLRTLRAQYGLQVEIRGGDSHSLFAGLADHKLDLVLANDRPPTLPQKPSFYARLVGEFAVLLVASPRLGDLREGYPRSLDTAPVILPGRGGPLRADLEQFLAIKRRQPQVAAEVDSLELVKLAVLDGLGFSALPRRLILPELEREALYLINDMPICHENLWFITAQRLVQNDTVGQLRDSFRPT